jgi:hypothetical protein
LNLFYCNYEGGNDDEDDDDDVEGTDWNGDLSIFLGGAERTHALAMIFALNVSAFLADSPKKGANTCSQPCS